LLSGYPVREVTEVLIDGVAVDPTTYRLDERRYLTRVRDPLDPDTVLLWPNCQMLDVDETMDGSWSVTYRYGQDAPLLGSAAAAQLGCELYRSCSGGVCALPVGTTRVARQGIVVEKMAFTNFGFVEDVWRTGLPLVDAFLNSYNPQRLRRRPAVFSPESPRYARSVGQ
jgi:hypothetical protein